MFIQYKFVEVFFIIIITLFICSDVCRSSEYKLKYPGNGIPYFSNNIEIKELEQDLYNYANKLHSLRKTDGRLIFNNINDFSYISKQKLYGDELSLEVELSINSGKCYLVIGNISYLITNNSIVVMDYGKIIYKNDGVKIKHIRLSKYGNNNSATSIYTDQKLLNVLGVNIITPSIIKLQLTNGCSGYIGPWMWIRGHM